MQLADFIHWPFHLFHTLWSQWANAGHTLKCKFCIDPGSNLDLLRKALNFICTDAPGIKLFTGPMFKFFYMLLVLLVMSKWVAACWCHSLIIPQSASLFSGSSSIMQCDLWPTLALSFKYVTTRHLVWVGNCWSKSSSACVFATFHNSFVWTGPWNTKRSWNYQLLLCLWLKFLPI